MITRSPDVLTQRVREYRIPLTVDLIDLSTAMWGVQGNLSIHHSKEGLIARLQIWPDAEHFAAELTKFTSQLGARGVRVRKIERRRGS